jgi:hypothetical protein
MATTTVPETALADQPDADRAPDIGADDLLVIGANMAEAANCLLPCLSPLARKAEGHPFYDKLSAIHDWLFDEGWRLLLETPATTAFGASVKARALDLGVACGGCGNEDELRASLIEDLEQLAKAELEANAAA